MLRRAIALVVLLAAGSAFAQGAYYGGPGPCGGWFTRHWVGQPDYGGGIWVGGGGGTPVDGGGVPVHGASGVGDVGGGGGDWGSGEVLLIAAVVIVAALPVFLYAIDEEATEDVKFCWAMPTERFDFYGGAMGLAPGASAGYAGARTSFSAAFFGIEAGAESSGFGYHDVSGALHLRAVPRQHVELAFAVGVRQVVSAYGVGTWLELSVPHRYLPMRANAMQPGVGLEVRPALLFGQAGELDARLDAAVLFQFGPWVSLQVGGRVYSLGSSVRFGGLVGMGLSL